MKKLTAWLLNHAKLTILFFFLLTLVCALLIPRVEINYDLAEYLPPESGSRQALDVMTQEFPYGATALVMAEDISLQEAQTLKSQISQVEGVQSVLWLDDMADVRQPLEFQDSSLLNSYYQDGNALFHVYFDEDDYSLVTGQALEEIRTLAADYAPAIYGSAEESRATREAVSTEMINIMLVVVPLCLLILVIISTSWFEPVLYIFVILIAVVLNMGTNLIFDSVSFIIFSMGAAIQLAVSMDYSLFFTHRFEEERSQGLGVREAIQAAAHKTFPSIFASALTTVAGFSALAFMDYGIGRDIGFVLAKGVGLSFFCVMFFLPPLLLKCHRWIEKTRHRTLLQIRAPLARALTKPRYLFLILALVVVIPAYFGQLNVDFLYGDSSGTSQDGTIAEEKARIQQTFTISNEIAILIPNGDVRREIQLAQALEDLPYTEQVQAIVTMVDPTIPRSLLPAAVLDNFVGENYSRMVVYTNVLDETPQLYAAVEQYRSTVAAIYGEDWYMVGKAPSIVDIRDSVQSDFTVIQIISLLAVALIILFTFRSLILPLLLVAVIQSATYINMCVPYFLDQPLIFIGYLVVSSLQLGATIDYAILTASRYMEARRIMPPREAVATATQRSGISVLTSGLILAVAGFAEAFLSQMSSVSEIGLLIGRGALLSMLLVLLVLPGVLSLFDRPIQWLTWRTGFLRKMPKSRKKKNDPSTASSKGGINHA